MDGWPLLMLLGGVLILVYLLLRWIGGRRRADGRPLAVIDGSNVMYWQDKTPRLQPLAAVLAELGRRGYQTGVVFDANAGYLLAGRYLDDHALGKALGIGQDRVMVVPKGVQADPYLLDYARQSGAIIISADRFRDRLAGYPELSQPGRIVRGGYRDGALWLDLPTGSPTGGPGPDQRLAAS
ncbi:MAG: hypothetical protein R3D63_00065 [Paracoccaceae bacterium]